MENTIMLPIAGMPPGTHPDVLLAVNLTSDHSIAEMARKHMDFCSACIAAGQPVRLGFMLCDFQSAFDFLPFYPTQPCDLYRFLQAGYAVFRVKDYFVVEVIEPLNIPGLAA